MGLLPSTAQETPSAQEVLQQQCEQLQHDLAAAQTQEQETKLQLAAITEEHSGTIQQLQELELDNTVLHENVSAIKRTLKDIRADNIQLRHKLKACSEDKYLQLYNIKQSLSNMRDLQAETESNLHQAQAYSLELKNRLNQSMTESSKREQAMLQVSIKAISPAV